MIFGINTCRDSTKYHSHYSILILKPSPIKPAISNQHPENIDIYNNKQNQVLAAREVDKNPDKTRLNDPHQPTPAGLDVLNAARPVNSWRSAASQIHVYVSGVSKS